MRAAKEISFRTLSEPQSGPATSNATTRGTGLLSVAPCRPNDHGSPFRQRGAAAGDKRCNLGPRGDACVYLIYDAATHYFWAKGAVNPKGGHRWYIDRVNVIACYPATTCVSKGEAGPSPVSAYYQSLTTPAAYGSICYLWYATMWYVVDVRDVYYVSSPGYGGIC